MQTSTHHNTRIADERFMPTEGITPMEKQISSELINNHGLFINEFEFRQRISCYHLRYNFWKRLPVAATEAIKRIVEQYGYRLDESDERDDDKFTRWSYGLTQVTYMHMLPVETKEVLA